MSVIFLFFKIKNTVIMIEWQENVQCLKCHKNNISNVQYCKNINNVCLVCKYFLLFCHTLQYFSKV